MHKITWTQIQNIPTWNFLCGHCDLHVASERGWTGQYPVIAANGMSLGTRQACLAVCPNCTAPSFFCEGRQIPGIAFGSSVDSLPPNVGEVYEEARNCMSIDAFTASAHLLRKLLMNIAVEKGAHQGQQFVDYITFLSDAHYVPPNGKEWVDHIRKMGNEAAHQIMPTNQATAENLISFTQMLLTFIYAFPAKIQRPDQVTQPTRQSPTDLAKG